MSRRYNKEESKRRILSACVSLFIHKGYHNTTLSEILTEANVTSSTFQNIFQSKDGVLLDLTEFMFDSQFKAARSVGELAPACIYIFERTSHELYKLFGTYNPTFSESDFYELEIGTAGIMRNYMAKKCDMYFTLERKLERFLNMSLGAYNVPEEERVTAIKFVLGIDIRRVANKIMQELFCALAMHFEFDLGKGK